MTRITPVPRPDPSAQQIHRRRRLFLGCWLAVCLPGCWLMATWLRPGGITLADAGVGLLFGVLFAQVAYGATLAAAGYCVLRRRGDPLRLSQSLGPDALARPMPSTAIVMPIFNENVGRVFQGLRVMYESLQRTGRAETFDLYVLSDSSDPNVWIEEETAWVELCKQLQGFGRVFYRKRRVQLNHKSGNLADFCRRWGAYYRYMIVLDADSLMTGELFVRLVQLMERNPSVGMIQTAPRPVLGRSLFSRIQQFAAHVYGPVFAAGANFWQLAGATYWGHNAIIRVRPFMAFCALPELPRAGRLGGRILSHDTVEAAFMRTAGYGVWCAHDLAGSYEEGPPDLLAALRRDRRWCLGNLQHLWVLLNWRLPADSRLHLLIGIMSYLSAPLWLLFILLTTWSAPQARAGGHAAGAGWLFGYGMCLLLLPKVLGGLWAWRPLDRPEASRCRASLLPGIALEVVFSALLAPILMVSYTAFVGGALTGLQVRWGRQNRGEDRPAWSEVLRAHAGQTVLGILGVLGASRWAPWLLPWLAPVLAGLVLAVPFARFTSSHRLGAAARERGWFLTPEEATPPPELLQTQDRLPFRENSLWVQLPYAQHRGLLQAVLDPYVHAVHLSLLRLREEGADRTRDYATRLCHLLLAEGPGHLTEDERSALLWDAQAMGALHKELWICSPDRLAQWWQHALRRYNDTAAAAARQALS